jgi:hypothetical protein
VFMKKNDAVRPSYLHGKSVVKDFLESCLLHFDDIPAATGIQLKTPKTKGFAGKGDALQLLSIIHRHRLLKFEKTFSERSRDGT